MNLKNQFNSNFIKKQIAISKKRQELIEKLRKLQKENTEQNLVIKKLQIEIEKKEKIQKSQKIEEMEKTRKKMNEKPIENSKQQWEEVVLESKPEKAKRSISLNFILNSKIGASKHPDLQRIFKQTDGNIDKKDKEFKLKPILDTRCQEIKENIILSIFQQKVGITKKNEQKKPKKNEQKKIKEKPKEKLKEKLKKNQSVNENFFLERKKKTRNISPLSNVTNIIHQFKNNESTEKNEQKPTKNEVKMNNQDIKKENLEKKEEPKNNGKKTSKKNTKKTPKKTAKKTRPKKANTTPKKPVQMKKRFSVWSLFRSMKKKQIQQGPSRVLSLRLDRIKIDRDKSKAEEFKATQSNFAKTFSFRVPQIQPQPQPLQTSLSTSQSFFKNQNRFFSYEEPFGNRQGKLNQQYEIQSDHPNEMMRQAEILRQLEEEEKEREKKVMEEKKRKKRHKKQNQKRNSSRKSNPRKNSNSGTHNNSNLKNEMIYLTESSILFELQIFIDRYMKYLVEFSSNEHNEENVLFWFSVNKFKQLCILGENEIAIRYANLISQTFIEDESNKQVNISGDVRRRIAQQLKKIRRIPNPQLFDAAEKQIYELMSNDQYLNFFRSKYYFRMLKEIYQIGKKVKIKKSRKLF
ncbi:regulator of g protein signaling-related [Anaeramoeba ignava]|uniref:Regulator of g protein signaling-related n=1 Tax=Anaeramoeba ignava TaxID=1746090 RepID=A0A9Q0L7L9_ANAIG|nr:regulator of g protein signaling-related [Anaeramoeba ignava]